MKNNTQKEIVDFVKSETNNFIISNKLTCTAKKISDKIHISRSLISHYLNEAVKDKTMIKVGGRPVFFLDKETIEKNYKTTFSSIYEYVEDLFLIIKNHGHNDTFSQAIGFDTSLRRVISQCKAALHYPNNGIPLIFAGDRGTGKKFIARLMYYYAIKENIINSIAGFINYKALDNQKENDRELFGYFENGQKIKGLLEKAENGIIYIEDSEKLCDELQNKIYKYISESKKNIKKSRIILSTTNKPETVFINELINSIPLVADFPPFSARDMFERNELTLLFLKREEEEINAKFFVTPKVISCLSNYNYSDNLDGLKSTIKRSCADAFLEANKKESIDSIEIDLHNLSSEILLNIKEDEIAFIDNEKIAVDEFVIENNNQKSLLKLLNESIRIYEDIQDINQVVSKIFRLIINYNNLYFFSEENSDSFIFCKNVINKVITNIVNKYNLLIPKNFEVLLAKLLYMNVYSSTLSLWEEENMDNSQKLFDAIKEKMPISLDIALNINKNISKMFSIIESKMNVVFAAIIIETYNKDFTDKKYIGLIISHGSSTASSIADAANALIGNYTFDAIDMKLKSSVEDTIMIANEFIKKKSYKKDVVVLVDMGSLEQIGSTLSKTTNSRVGVINNISTSVALNAGLKMNQGLDMKKIFESIVSENICKYTISNSKKKNAIIVFDDTGYSMAKKISQLFRDSLNNKDIDVISMDYKDITNKKFIENELENINIIFAVGTTSIKLENIVFVSLEDVINFKNIKEINKLLANYLSKEQIAQFNTNLVSNFSLENVIQNITILNPNVLLKHIEEAVELLQRNLNLSFSNKILVGLYIHLCCMVERLITKNEYRTHEELDNFINNEKEFISSFRSSFSRVVSHYNIEIPLSEIQYIFDYIKNN